MAIIKGMYVHTHTLSLQGGLLAEKGWVGGPYDVTDTHSTSRVGCVIAAVGDRAAGVRSKQVYLTSTV